jgi:hypothetical protein
LAAAIIVVVIIIVTVPHPLIILTVSHVLPLFQPCVEALIFQLRPAVAIDGAHTFNAPPLRCSSKS